MPVRSNGRVQSVAPTWLTCLFEVLCTDDVQTVSAGDDRFREGSKDLMQWKSVVNVWFHTRSNLSRHHTEQTINLVMSTCGICILPHRK